jgi:hypothetical protein
MNRETWLNELAQMMAPRFEELGYPLPKFRVAIGWPSAGKDAPVTGECWDKRVSTDGHFEIFLNPGRDADVAVACTLAHELVHAAVGLHEGHKGNFAKVAMALGFVRPLTNAQEPDALVSWVRPMLDKLGKIPHGAINYTKGGAVRVKRNGAGVQPVGDNDNDEDAAPINNRPPKQSTRLLKVICTECGYTARVTRKWLEHGAPHCPKHGAMLVDTTDDAEAA